MHGTCCGVWAAVVILALPLASSADEQKVAIEDLPKAVVEAVQAKYAGAELTGATRDTEKGRTYYTVTIRHKGSELDVSVTPAGKVTEVRKDIAVGDLPKPVRDAVGKKYPGARLTDAEEVTDLEEDNEISYEVTLRTDKGKKREVTVDAGGKSLREDVKVEALPDAVLEALNKKYPKARIDDAEEVTALDAEGRVTYEVTLRPAKGKEVEVTLDRGGKVQKEEPVKDD